MSNPSMVSAAARRFNEDLFFVVLLMPDITLRQPATAVDAARCARRLPAVHAAAVRACGRGNEPRRRIASTVIEDVADGHWAGNGLVWQCDDVVRAAGYAPLQPAPCVGGVR
ncbi:hypothetical protein ACPEH1_13665 [Stenotrophomonas sp. NPDC077421]|uniref:hypothetical protein n=1 Tax=Stenotrophomonas sp. NPDC077421 TaxID=3414699 RepID=UPI003C2C11F2